MELELRPFRRGAGLARALALMVVLPLVAPDSESVHKHHRVGLLHNSFHAVQSLRDAAGAAGFLALGPLWIWRRIARAA